MSGFTRTAIACLMLASPVALCGCSITGASLGADQAAARGGTPVAWEQAGEIEVGTPVQVGLPDGGHVRGIWLGMLPADSTSTPARAERCRLGVGNRMVIDRLFERSRTLTAPTTADVPDTLVFPRDRVRALSIPVSSHSTARGAAAGAALDVSVAAVLLWTTFLGGLGLLAFALR
jgi:hypothetical protein